MKSPSSNHPGVRALSAFTLVEMMVVLTLIAILTAMIIPEMKGTFEDALLRTTGRELVNVIELASSRAISLNQTVRVKLDVASGRYQIERQTRAGSGEDFEPLKGVSGSHGSLDKRISIQLYGTTEEPADASSGAVAPDFNHEPSLKFYPDGTAEGATIALKDPAGFRLELRVSAITSRVSILEPAHE